MASLIYVVKEPNMYGKLDTQGKGRNTESSYRAENEYHECRIRMPDTNAGYASWAEMYGKFEIWVDLMIEDMLFSLCRAKGFLTQPRSVNQGVFCRDD